MDNNQLGEALQAKKQRAFDALRLFRPLPTHLPAITTEASELIIRGGNRSGKSIMGAAIVASVARNMPIIGLDGKPLPRFLDHDHPKLIWVIGLGEDHIGQTLHRLLFEPGQVPLFKDPKTRLVRGARNYMERSIGREQRLVSSPFIPEDEIKSKAWNNFAKKNFDTFTLHNGNKIVSFTSGGDVKMGDPVDLIWIDEDIKYPKYVAEWQARLSDTKGRLIWTAWPHSSNYALVELSNRAKAEETYPKPDVKEIILRFSDNPLIDENEKRKRRSAWSYSGPSEVRSRDDGEFTNDDILMYPGYSKLVHGIKRIGVAPDKLEKFLEACGYDPPGDWTRYMVIDPGHAYTGILFAAVPPKGEFGDVVVIYDELYLRGCDAAECAKYVKEKIAGKGFAEFVIDGRIARETSIGVGKTYYQIYQEAFAKAGLRSAMGCSFTFSSDNVSAGIMGVRAWMTIRDDGTTKLRVVNQKCPNFDMEIERYRKKIVQDETQDKPADGQRDHLMDGLRYLAMHGCEWRTPVDPAEFVDPGGAYQWFKDLWQGEGEKQPGADQQPFHLGAGAIRAA